MVENHVEISEVSLEDKLVHKNWKLRKSGYDELCELISASSSESQCSKWRDTVLKASLEANIPVLDSALRAILSYVKKVALNPKFEMQLVQNIVSKCLVSSKASINSASCEIILILCESRANASIVLECLLGVLSHKTPRVVYCALNALREMIDSYGCTFINTNLIIKSVVKCFENKDITVRKEVNNLLIEIYKWTHFDPNKCLSALRPVQLKEFKDSLLDVPNEPPKARRALKQIEVLDNVSEKSEIEIQEEVLEDPYAKAAPVDILPDLENLLKDIDDKSWVTRNTALQKLNKSMTVLRIKEGDFNALVKKLCAKVMDSNINVCVSAVNCLDSLCLGIRSHFSIYKQQVLSVAIEKLKEKKKNVVESLRDLLDSVFSITGDISSLAETIAEASSHKNQNVRAEVIFWSIRCLRVQKVPLEKFAVPILFNMGIKCAEDQDKIVREYAAEFTAAMIKVTNDSTCMQKLDKQRIAKIKDYSGKIQLGLPSKYLSEKYLLSRNVTYVKPPEVKVQVPADVPIDVPVDLPVDVPADVPVDGPETEQMDLEINEQMELEVKIEQKLEDTDACTILSPNLKLKQNRTSANIKHSDLIPEKIKTTLQEQAKGVINPKILDSFTCWDKSSINSYEESVILCLDQILMPIEAAENMAKCASDNSISVSDLKKRYISASDVLFMCAIYMLYYQNDNISMRCLILIQHLINLFDNENLSLTEYEAKILSYFLLIQMPQKDKKSSEMSSAIFKKLTRVYPASMLIVNTCEIINQTNANLPLCARELLNLMERNHIVYSCPEKVKQTVKLLLSSEILSEDIREKLRNLVSPSDKTRKNTPNEENITANLTRGLPLVASPKIHTKTPPWKTETPPCKTETPSCKTETPSCKNEFLQENLSQLGHEVQDILTALTQKNNALKISSLKRFEKLIEDNAELALCNEVIRVLTPALVLELKDSISLLIRDEPSVCRLCKHIINVLANIFRSDSVRRLGEHALKLTLIGILNLLLELSFINSDPCKQLSKVLNVLVIRILERAHTDELFKVLINILKEILTPPPYSDPKLAMRQKKTAELVMKCLWKITKNIDTFIEDNKINVAQLVLNCHQFLEAIPPIEWKRRSNKSSLFCDELPLKTIKTIMKELTRVLGIDIFSRMENIAYPDQSYAVSYIKQALKADQKI